MAYSPPSVSISIGLPCLRRVCRLKMKLIQAPPGSPRGAFSFVGLLNKLLGLVPKAAAPATYLESTMGLLDQAHSFAQGASNGVASSLTGPVDGLAWLLRKAGVPVPQAPLGGSDWMRNVGLMQEPKERMAGLLGEGIGSALPTVIAGKAPQIANGLLQMERNAMAPRTLNPQTGAIVWHGSPHKFDKFDSSKIGTGEGAQAYGHGLYLAESPVTAKTYQGKVSAMLGSGEATISGKPINWDDPAQAAAFELARHNGDRLAAADFYERTFKSGKVPELLRSDKPLPNVDLPGNLYKVDLPDEAIAKMLDWDKPLSQQSHVMELINKQEAARTQSVLDQRMQTLANVGENAPNASVLKRQIDLLREEVAKPQESGLGAMTGGEYYNYLRRRDVAPTVQADMFKQAGIPGIRYLDGGSRGAGAGTSNFVVFPGNEGLLKILERNGQGLLGN